MGDIELVTAADVRLMQGLAQRVTAVRPDLVNTDASFGELAWIWGKGHAALADEVISGAGATHMTVACLGAPGHPRARGLYYGVGFRQLSRDVPLIKPAV